ncbi:MAG TPA: hypothetical protein VJ728_01005 [Candidatus Binataceae bacterium]|nr:hypothetical protein [Candidatus Binataceae bacterium]
MNIPVVRDLGWWYVSTPQPFPGHLDGYTGEAFLQTPIGNALDYLLSQIPVSLGNNPAAAHGSAPSLTQQCLSNFSKSTFGQVVQFFSPLSLIPSFNQNAAQNQQDWLVYGSAKGAVTFAGKADQFSGSVELYSLSTGTYANSAAGAASFFDAAEIGGAAIPALALVVDAAAHQGCRELGR